MSTITYTPLLATVSVVGRKPKQSRRRPRQPKAEAKVRLGFQQPLPFSVGEPVREYVLKSQPKEK